MEGPRSGVSAGCSERDVPAELRLSNSSAELPLTWKIHELASLFARNVRFALNPETVPSVLAFCDEYEALLRNYSNLALEKAKVFEVGFGPRAEILTALVSLGVDAYGIDLDAPLMRGTAREMLHVFRKNGIERALKSAIRFALFDSVFRRRLRSELRQRGRELALPERRMLIGDAASAEWPDGSFDLITSKSVFEHIPVTSLKPLVAKMARWLKPRGLGLIGVCTFTGISGGHLTEWFDLEKRPRRSEPWEHLRKKRFHGNVYLNELARADYRRLFCEHFQILEEKVSNPDYGREYLTQEIVRELRQYGEDELLGNGVLFVLRPKCA